MIRTRTGAFTHGNLQLHDPFHDLGNFTALRSRADAQVVLGRALTALSVAEAGVPPVSLIAWSTAASSGAVSSVASCGEQPSRRCRINGVEATR